MIIGSPVQAEYPLHLNVYTEGRSNFAPGDTIPIVLKGMNSADYPVTLATAAYRIAYELYSFEYEVFHAERVVVPQATIYPTKTFIWSFHIAGNLTGKALPGNYIFGVKIRGPDGDIVGEVQHSISISYAPWLAQFFSPMSSLETLPDWIFSRMYLSQTPPDWSILLPSLLPLSVAAIIGEGGGRLLRTYFAGYHLGSARGGRPAISGIIFVTLAPFLSLGIVNTTGSPNIVGSLIDQFAGTAILTWTQFAYARFLFARKAVEIAWDYYAIGYIQLIVNAMILGVPLGIPFIGIRHRSDPRKNLRAIVALPFAWLILAIALIWVGYTMAGGLVLLGAFYYSLPLEGTNGRLLWRAVIWKALSIKRPARAKRNVAE